MSVSLKPIKATFNIDRFFTDLHMELIPAKPLKRWNIFYINQDTIWRFLCLRREAREGIMFSGCQMSVRPVMFLLTQ